MRRTQKNGRTRRTAGTGNGAHHEVSPMARGTATKTRREKRQRADRFSRKAKHKGRYDHAEH